MYKFNDFGAVAAISFGFLLAGAVPIFAASSRALPGLFVIFFPTFLAAFAVALPKCSKKSPNPSLFIV